MSKNKIKFNEAFAAYGGLFNIEHSTLDDRLKVFLKDILHEIQKTIEVAFLGDLIPDARSVYVDYIDNTTPNAMARGDLKCIGINYGLVLNMFDFYTTLMCCEDVFSDIDSGSEIFTLSELESDLKSISTQYRFSYLPKSNKRTELAALLAKIAIFWIVGHELSHVLKHSKYYAEKYNADIIPEFFDPSLFKDPITFYEKALELDADRNGCLVSFWLTHFYYEDESTGLYLDFDGPSYIWMMAITTLLFLFENSENFVYPNKISTHPIAYIRQIFCIQFMKLAAQEIELSYKVDYTRTLAYKLDFIEKIIGKISIKEGVQKNAEMENEYRNLIQHLSTIQTEF